MPTTSPSRPERDRRLLDTAATAQYLGVTERWVRSAWATRQLPAVRLGRLIRFRVDDLDAFVAAGRVPAVRGPLAS